MSFDLAKAGSSGYSGLQQRRKQARKNSPFGGRGITDRVDDPFASTSPAAIDQTIGKYAGMYGTPQTDTQIQSTAQGLIDPVVAAITGRARQSAASILGNSGSLARELGAIDFGAPYTQGKTEQAAVDEALRSSLAGEGGRLSADLQGRLGAIEDPAVAAAGGNVAATGAAAGNTELARGSASLSNLIALAAAGRSYGAKLPGIAKLSGLQDISAVNRDAQQQVADKTADLTPQLVMQLRNERSSLRGNKAQLAAQLYSTLTGQNVTKATAKAGLAGDQAQLDYNYANAKADAAASQASLDERTRHDKAIENAKGAPKPLTAAVREKALKAIDLYYYGVHPKQHYSAKAVEVVDPVTGQKVMTNWVEEPGTGTPGVDYQTAVSNLMTGFGLSAEQATSLANMRYKPGEDGRPPTAQQVAKRKQAAEAKAASTAGAALRASNAPSATTRPPGKPNPNSWDPKQDPIVAPGPPGTGTARTRSGRYVDVNFGAYVNAPGT